MNDLTEVFKSAIEKADEYKFFSIANKIQNIDNTYINDADRYSWALITEEPEHEYIIHGYISQHYPVALIKDSCNASIIEFLTNNNIEIAMLEEPFSCEEEILKKYSPSTRFLDDRFLENEDFKIDDERLWYIYNNISYVTPYNFTFEDIDT